MDSQPMNRDAIKELAREFAKRTVAPAAAETDRTGALPEQLFRQMGDAGLMGLIAPETYGGTEQGLGAAIAVVEALAESCASTAWVYLAHTSLMQGITVLGTPAQKERYLPALAKGQMLGTAVAGTEASGGSSPMGMRTMAEATDGGFVINGSKVFISNAGFADLYLLMARTGKEPGPGSFTMFVVEKNTPGLSFPHREETLGMHGVTVGEIQLENCRVGKDQVLGQVGGGLAVMGPVGGAAVTGAAALAVGMARSAVDMTRSYLKERVVAGQALAAIPAVQQNWARLLLDFETCVAMAGHSLTKLASGGPPIVPFLAKVQTTEAAQRIIDRCLQFHGMYGYSREYPLERLYRDCRALSIHWANNDVLITNVGQMSLS